MSLRTSIGVWLFCISCVGLLPAQDTHAQINLAVVAEEKSGQPIPGLTQQDFTVLDDKVPQKITSFQALTSASATPPVEATVVLDEVNDSFTNVAYERAQLTRYLKRDDARLSIPTSLAFFSDSGLKLQGTPTLDGNALVEALKENENAQRTIRRNQGFYGAADRLNLSLNAIGELINYNAARPGRKLVIWISPGWPILSGPHVDLTSKDQQHLFATIVDLSTRLREANITLYSIDPLGTADAGGLRTIYYQAFLKGVKKPSQVQFGNVSLQVLATQSGGLVLNSSNDVSSEIAQTLADARVYYLLSFDSAGADGPNDYHSIEVKVDRPGVIARTRTGYYAEPEQGPTR